MKDTLRCRDEVGLRRARNHAAMIRVSIEAREVRARDLYPNPMSVEKDIAGRPEIHIDLIHLSRSGNLLPAQTVAVAHPQDSVGNPDRRSIRIDIQESDREVSVTRRSRDAKSGSDGACDLNVIGEDLGCIDEDVLASP
jgi:hypothetical protein